MSIQQPVKHYARLLTRWPVDSIRPDQVHFQNLLRSRITALAGSGTNASTHNELKEANCAYLLSDNSFAKQYPVSPRMLKPDSAPEHYTNLEKELQEVPNRSYLGNLWKRMTKLVRLR